MKTWPLSALAFVASPLLAVQQLSAAPERDAMFAAVWEEKATPRLALRPHEDAVRNAIGDMPAERKTDAFSADSGALSGSAYRAFAHRFAQARKTHCLGPDPLKHQPHTIETKDWVFGVGGIYAAPFWVAAVVRGKCNWSG